MSKTNELLKMVDEIEAQGSYAEEELTSWEIEFVGGMIDRPPATFSEKQEEKLEQIYKKVFG